MPVKEIAAKQALGSKYLVMIAKPFHRPMKKAATQEGSPNSEHTDSK